MISCVLSPIIAAAALVGSPAEDTRWTADVGMPVSVSELVIDGPELKVKPTDYTTPVIVRIDAVRPHGSAHRYDIEFYALEAGDHDLGDYLQRRDGEVTQDLPKLLLTAHATLAPAEVRPRTLPTTAIHDPPRYRKLLVAGAVAWGVGFLAILLLGRRRARAQTLSTARAESLADRLRPLIEKASDGTLEPARLAELELSLVAWWRRRLGLEAADPRDALQSLLAHDEAGPLLRGIEGWLHRPGPRRQEDLPALLAPYRNLPADALTLPAGAKIAGEI